MVRVVVVDAVESFVAANADVAVTQKKVSSFLVCVGEIQESLLFYFWNCRGNCEASGHTAIYSLEVQKHAPKLGTQFSYCLAAFFGFI